MPNEATSNSAIIFFISLTLPLSNAMVQGFCHFQLIKINKPVSCAAMNIFIDKMIQIVINGNKQ